ncbi:MAG: aminoacyl-tRNA deacylase [Lautropia sp.]
MSRPDSRRGSATPATQLLRRAGVAFAEHHYDYVDRGGTGEAAKQLGIDEHRIVKTLLMQADGGEVIVLMHGDRSVSTRNLGRAIGARTVAPCAPEQAQRITGYRVGGISPFGTRKRLPVYVERSILELPTLLINGGQRGYLIEIAPAVLTAQLAATPVDCAIAGG